ncbi:MAG: hypothetical protein C9356_13660 [Oleiphilus sp.]|nr:MAG: hypothetical protein C9356_13660 [Oleiphilus sp.]
MIISTIIHGLEVATLCLVGLLTYQLVKCYRTFYRHDETSRSDVQGLAREGMDAEADGLDASSILVEQGLGPEVHAINAGLAVKSSAEAAVAASATPAAEPVSKAILNDYIGGFFAETPVPDLQAYRAESTAELSGSAEKAMDQEVSTAVETETNAVSVSTEQLAEFRAPETIEPVLVKPVRVVDLDEEDTFIVVEDENVLCHASNENVMSDKVVMAMLKEANMVASS